MPATVYIPKTREGLQKGWRLDAAVAEILGWTAIDAGQFGCFTGMPPSVPPFPSVRAQVPSFSTQLQASLDLYRHAVLHWSDLRLGAFHRRVMALALEAAPEGSRSPVRMPLWVLREAPAVVAVAFVDAWEADPRKRVKH